MVRTIVSYGDGAQSELSTNVWSRNTWRCSPKAIYDWDYSHVSESSKCLVSLKIGGRYLVERGESKQPGHLFVVALEG